LLLLQLRHNTWMLLGVFVPPCEIGTMWSPVRSSVVPQTTQYGWRAIAWATSRCRA